MHRPTRHAGLSRQRGAALMVMLVIVVMGIAAALISSLGSTALKNEQQRKTAEALAQAKDALIGYAITYGDVPGFLPCPDVNETGITAEGIEHGNCGITDANSIGKFPWKSLGLPLLLDGNGECLWYAVSGTYKNHPPTDTTMNWDNPAQLHVYGSDGNEIAPGEIVAVIIAPGDILPDNASRSGTASPTCGGNYTAAAYLDHDPLHNINNADISDGKFILPHKHRDTDGNVTVALNDQFAYITRQDLWATIQRRVAREAKKCLDDYATANGGRYPWAVPLSTPTSFSPLMLGAYNTRFGRLPTHPNVQIEVVTNDIIAMQIRFAELWTTLTTFSADKSFTKLLAMRTSAWMAKNAADNVGDNYDGTPLENPADSLKEAADDALNNLTTSSSNAYIANIQQRIVDAANTFAATMSSEFTQASGMSSIWPTSCTLLTSAQWEHWKNLVFYQVTEGFKPGGTGNCGSCLSIEQDDTSLSGSGSYRAAVIVAGKKLTATRTIANIGDYLEADNLLPRNDTSQPYKTYRVTDNHYQTINDHILCLDGKENCK